MRGTAAAHSLFPLGALTRDVSHSPYPSSQLPPCQPAFLQVEGSSPRPAICSSSDKSQHKEQHTNKALHILNTGTVRRHSRAGGGLNPTAEEEHCPRTVPQGHQCHLGRKVSRAAIPKPHSSTAHSHTRQASEIEESSDQQWEMQFSLSFYSTFLCTEHFPAPCRERLQESIVSLLLFKNCQNQRFLSGASVKMRS